MPPERKNSRAFSSVGPAHGAHGRQHQHPVRSVRNVQSAVADFGPRQRLRIHEDEIVAVVHQRRAGGEGGLGGFVAAQSGLAGSDRIHHGDVALVDTLAHQVRKPLEVLEEHAHVLPVRHAEMVARRRPLPETAVRRVVQAVQVQQIAAIQVVLARGEHQVLRRSAPTQAVIAFQPDPRPFVQLGDGAGDLALDQIRSSARRIVAGSRVPAHAAEIIAELQRVAAAAALIAAVDLAPAPVPLEDRDEVALLGQLHLDVHEVQPVLDGLGTDILEHRRQGLEQVVALAPLEILRPDRRPKSDRRRQSSARRGRSSSVPPRIDPARGPGTAGRISPRRAARPADESG